MPPAGETRREMQSTLELCEALDVTDFGYFVFYPYPGTALFHTCRREGWLPRDWIERPANHRQSILQLPGLTPADVAEVYDGFTALRQRIYARRHGLDPDASEARSVEQLLEQSAAVG